MSAFKYKNEYGSWTDIPFIKGDSGKSAYQYAQEKGYIGTEEEFAQKLAEDNQIIYVTMTASEGQTNLFTTDKTALEVIELHNSGKSVKCKINFNGFPLVLPLTFVRDNVVAYSGIGLGVAVWVVHSQNTGTLSAEEYVTADDVPTTLPNPNQLTFTGAVEATYDGSEDVTVDIPSGGRTPTRLTTFELAEGEEVSSITIDACDDGTPFTDAGWRKVGVRYTTQGKSDLTDYANLNVVVNGNHPRYGYGTLKQSLHNTKRLGYFTLEAQGRAIELSYKIGFDHCSTGGMLTTTNDIISCPDGEIYNKITSVKMYHSVQPMLYGTKIEVWGIA